MAGMFESYLKLGSFAASLYSIDKASGDAIAEKIFPMLNKVKGLVFNWGSPYDHPGIIAREMNIPAIYKTNNATEVLATGDEVELDGYSGVVTVLSKAALNAG